MNLESNPTILNQETFKQQFPHLEHHNLTPEQQERFLVLHVHNEKKEAADKRTHDQLLNDIYATVPKKEDELHTHKEHRKNVTESSSMRKITTNFVDFVPVVGSAKMIMEGLKGKQYGTEKEIHGMSRIVHTASGVAFLALDITGAGVIVSELGKGALKIGERILVRNIEERLLEKEVVRLSARGKERVQRKEAIREA